VRAPGEGQIPFGNFASAVHLVDLIGDDIEIIAADEAGSTSATAAPSGE